MAWFFVGRRLWKFHLQKSPHRNAGFSKENENIYALMTVSLASTTMPEGVTWNIFLSRSRL